MTKNLILLLFSITICYACKKSKPQQINPQTTNTAQSNCGPMGECFAGVYVCDSTYCAQFLINNPGTVDTTIYGFTISMLADRDSAFTSSLQKVHYYMDSTSMQLSFLSDNTKLVYGSVWLPKNDYWGGFLGLMTKTGKAFVLVKH